jgi:hypothetical protein
MTSSFVPPRNPNVAGLVVVRRGETLGALCRRLGRSPADYPELVATNLSRDLDTRGPLGSCAVLAGLQEGDKLFVPAEWGAALTGLLGNAGRISDELVDTIEGFYPYQPGGPVNEQQYDGMVEVLAAWWRLQNPNNLPTSTASLAPFAKPLIEFFDAIGKFMPNNEVLAKIPWGSVPWGFVTALAKQGFPWWSLDFQKINKILISRVAPGSVKHAPPILDWSKTSFDKATLNNQKMDNTAIWAMLPKLRWDLFPDTQINAQTYKVGDNPTSWLVQQIEKLYPVSANDVPDAAIEDLFPGGGGGLDFLSCGIGKVKLAGKCYGVAAPDAGGCPTGTISYSGACIVNPCADDQTPQVDATTGITCLGGSSGTNQPGGQSVSCPPGATQLSKTSCDCKPLGALFVYDPVRNECVDCGPNTTYNSNTGECSCLPGFTPSGIDPNAPAGDNFYGCVAVALPPPVLQCGAGTKLVGGKCVPDPPPEEKKDDTTKKVVTAIGVVVGLVAVAYGLKMISKKK